MFFRTAHTLVTNYLLLLCAIVALVESLCNREEAAEMLILTCRAQRLVGSFRESQVIHKFEIVQPHSTRC
jgi:hypothetical protein